MAKRNKRLQDITSQGSAVLEAYLSIVYYDCPRINTRGRGHACNEKKKLRASGTFSFLTGGVSYLLTLEACQMIASNCPLTIVCSSLRDPRIWAYHVSGFPIYSFLLSLINNLSTYAFLFMLSVKLFFKHTVKYINSLMVNLLYHE